MPSERQPVTSITDADGNTIWVFADDQQTELNGILTDLVGPLQQSVREQEAELTTIYRPLIAEQSVYTDNQRDALDQLITQTLAPLRADLAAIGYETSVVINDYEIDPETLMNPQPGPVPGMIPAADVLPVAPQPVSQPVPLPGVMNPGRASHPENSPPIGWQPNTPVPPGCLPIITSHTRLYPSDDAFRNNSDRSFAQVVKNGPGGFYYTYATDPAYVPGHPEYLYTVNAPSGYRPVEGPVKGIFHWLCPIFQGVPQQFPVDETVAVPEPTFDPTRDVLEGFLGGNTPSTAPAEPPLIDLPRGILGTWNPCDPTFPDELDKLVKGLTKVGRTLVELQTNIVDGFMGWLDESRIEDGKPSGAVDYFTTWLTSSIETIAPDSGSVDAILKAIRGSGEIVKTAARYARMAVQVQRDLPLLMEQGRGELLVGAWFIRAVFNALTDVRFGWTLGPEFLSNMKLELNQLNTILDHVINYIWPVKPMELADVSSAYSTNDITDTQARVFTELHGYDWNCQAIASYSRRQQPTADQLMSLFLRGAIDRQQFMSAMRGQNWLNPQDVATFEASYVFIPPPSDAIRFAVRDVFDPNKLGRAEMEAELRQQKGLMEALAAVGIKATKIKPEGFEELDYDIPLAYWLASFEEASPTQVYAGLQRLRPNRVDRYKQLATDAEIAANPALTAGASVTPGPKPGTKWITPNPVTLATVNKLLKEKDYNPIWRPMLAAISYRVTGRIDAKRFYKLGAFGPIKYTAGFGGKPGQGLTATGDAEKELFEAFQDQGYSPDDAILHAYSVAAELELSAGLQRRKAERSAVCTAYTEGVYDRNTAIDTLVATGLAVDDAAGQMDACDVKARLRLLKAGKAAVRRGFFGGAFDEQKSRGLLRQMGVTDRVIEESLRLWKMQRDAQPREPKATELCQWVKEGLLTQGQMETRLLNLGYRPDDVVRIVRHCQLGALADAAKLREKRYKAELAETRRRERIVKQQTDEQERDSKAAFKAFTTLQTDKNLKAWLSAGLITPDMVRASYLSRGVSADDVERMLRLWTPKENGEGGDDEQGT